MDILFLTSYLPAAPDRGSAIRSHHFLRGLAARGHRVHLLSFATEAELPRAGALEGVCASVSCVPIPDFGVGRGRLRRLADLASSLPYQQLAFRSETFRERLVSLQEETRFDLVHVDLFRLASYWEAIRHPSVLDTHNVETLRARRAAEAAPAGRQLHRAVARLEAWKVARREARCAPRFDLVTAVSEEDAQALREIAPAARVATVPMGVDVEAFRASGPSPGAGRIVFVGSLFYGPNADAAVRFCEEILPAVRRAHPACTFAVVGHEPPESVRSLAGRIGGVSVAGSVPDVRPFLEGADVVVVPLRGGGGVKSKVLEAFAMSRAVVTTSIGAEGIAGLRDGEHALVADDPGAFAARVSALLSDAAARERLGTAGRALVGARYAWSRSLEALEAVYGDVLRRRRR